MKKKFLILPVVAALFAACTNDELLVNENQGQQTVDDGAIAFDAYLNRTVTRAGAVGGADLTSLRTPANGGFGVFAYYANGDLYSENAIPDFMYNQQVKYNTDHWEYSPVKYWPNEFGSSAISTGVDRVTFFAYAPYVGVDPATGQLTSHYTNDPASPELSTETGITALTRNGKTGDPYVRYVGSFEPAKCVDLLYGVAAEVFNSSVGAADGANSIKAGDPYINVAKPDIYSRLKFNFKHALAKLHVNVDADVDIINHDGVDLLDSKTRIWVRSINFDGIAQRGYLNLNSGMWYDVIDNNKISHASVTVHDGRRDGAEAIADDSYETPTGFNEALIQKAKYKTSESQDANGVYIYSISDDFSTTTGVTGTNQNLFSGDGNLFVIPANEQLKVTIVYDVETADLSLPAYLSDGVTKGSTVENKITKSITLGGNALKLEAGNAYTINLHLGMTSVKFDATVTDWVDNGEADVDLPINGPIYAAGSPDPNLYDVSVPASGLNPFKFAISGLAANAAVTHENYSWSDITSSATADPANASGVAVESIVITPNNSTKNRKNTHRWVSTGTVRLTFNQAAEIGFSGLSLSVGSNTITCTWSATDIDKVTDMRDAPNGEVKVYKNGVDITSSCPLNGDHTITLPSVAVAGEKYTVTLKANDAPMESRSITL